MMKLIRNYCLLLISSFITISTACGQKETEKHYRFDTEIESLSTFFEYRPNNRPIISGHRGTIEGNVAENSIEAFSFVLRYTDAIFEVDPRLTKDSVMVLFHDETMERISNRSWKMSNYTRGQINDSIYLKNNSGAVTSSKIPDLDAAIAWSKGKTVLNLDKKDVPMVKMAEFIETFHLEQQLMLTVHTGAQARFYYDRFPSIMFSAFCRNAKEYDDLEISGVPWKNMIAYVGTSINSENQPIVDQLHKNSVKCMVSFAPTIDKIEDKTIRDKKYREEIAKKPDIVETDRPVEVATILKEMFE